MSCKAEGAWYRGKEVTYCVRRQGHTGPHRWHVKVKPKAKSKPAPSWAQDGTVTRKPKRKAKAKPKRKRKAAPVGIVFRGDVRTTTEATRSRYAAPKPKPKPCDEVWTDRPRIVREEGGTFMHPADRYMTHAPSRRPK